MPHKDAEAKKAYQRELIRQRRERAKQAQGDKKAEVTSSSVTGQVSPLVKSDVALASGASTVIPAGASL